MGSCVWRVARSTYPDAKITAIIQPRLAPLLEGVTELDSIIAVDTKKSVFAAARAIREQQSDAVVLLPNSIRSAIIAKLGKVPIRCGYKRDGRSWLLTHRVDVQQHEAPMSTSAYYLHLANELFGSSEKETIPRIGISQSQHDKADQVLRHIENPIVLLVIGASKSEKRWAPKNFARVADALHAVGATCCIVASPQEGSIVQEVMQAATSPIADLSGEGITLGSLKAIVNRADVMVTNDTGPRHIAVATGTNVITLYGPTDFRWTQYDSKHDIPLLAEPFLPDHCIADENPSLCSIEKIPVGDVIAAATKVLAP